MQERFLDFLGQAVAEEALYCLLGEKIATGSFRHVFAHAIDEDKIVKVELRSQSFHNIREWQLWQAARETRWAKWLCPVLHISGCGTVLIQRKATPLKKAPRRVPAFLQDHLKLENWGEVDGRAVCLDYGYEESLQWMLAKSKLKDWPGVQVKVKE